jgi:hypothetical protein
MAMTSSSQSVRRLQRKSSPGKSGASSTSVEMLSSNVSSSVVLFQTSYIVRIFLLGSAKTDRSMSNIAICVDMAVDLHFD